MRVPISYALHHPERVDVPVSRLDLAELERRGDIGVDYDEAHARPVRREV